jgi:tetratricopeptide (TPR) repeat protein
MCVLRLLLRGCRLSHASNVLVLAPGTTAKVEVLAGEHDAVYWGVNAEVLAGPKATLGATGLTAEAKQFLRTLDRVAPQDLAVAVPIPQALVEAAERSKFYAMAHKYLSRWGLYVLRQALAGTSAVAPVRRALTAAAYARFFEHYAEELLQPTPPGGLTSALLHYLQNGGEGRSATRGIVVGLARSLALAAVDEHPVAKAGELALAVDNIAITMREQGWLQNASLACALAFVVAPTDSRWRAVCSLVEVLHPMGAAAAEQERHSPRAVLLARRNSPHDRDPLVVACLQEAVDKRAASMPGATHHPSLLWYARASLLEATGHSWGAVRAYERASASATHDHSIEVIALAKSALGRARMAEQEGALPEAEGYLSTAAQLLRSDYPERPEAVTWADRLHRQSLINKLKSLDFLTDLDDAERTCRELARLEATARGGQPGEFVHRTRGRIAFYRHLRLGAHAQAHQAAKNLAADAGPRGRTTIVLGLCAAGIGKYVSGDIAGFRDTIAEAERTAGGRLSGWGRGRRIATACQVVAIVERRLLERRPLSDERAYLEGALSQLLLEEQIPAEVAAIWSYLTRSTLLIDECSGHVESLVTEDFARHFRGTARYGLQHLVGSAAVHSQPEASPHKTPSSSREISCSATIFPNASINGPSRSSGRFGSA